MSNDTSSSTVQAGPGLTGLCVLATIALIILKLTGVLSITWFIAFLPLIIGVGLSVLFLIIGAVLMIIFGALSGKR